MTYGSRVQRRRNLVARLSLVTALVAVLAACDSTSESPPDTGLPEGVDRCVPAPQPVLDYLATGFVSAELSFRFGFAVENQTYPDVWVVSAEVDDSANLAVDGDIGIWAIRADVWPTEYFGAAAVDNVATITTTWGDDIDVVLGPSLDGVKSAEACALARLAP